MLVDQYLLLLCSSVSSFICLHTSSWRWTSYSFFPGPLESLPTLFHISPYHSQYTCTSPLHGPILSSSALCSQSSYTTLNDAPIMLCCTVAVACLSDFSHPPNLKHPTSLCSSQLWGICLLHHYIPDVVHETYRWTKCVMIE